MRSFLAQSLICLSVAFAQTPQRPQKEVNWQTITDIPQVDLSGLTPAQKAAALKALRTQPCLCSCGMRVAECRVKDSNCGDSRALATVVIKAIREGQDVQAAVSNSDLVARRAGSPNVLEKPVMIPTKGSPVKGPETARITLVEFSDFECPYCSKAAAKIEAVLQAYPKDARLVYKQYPLPSHPHAKEASEAALAAFAQGKFWPMHDKLFANSNKLNTSSILQAAKEAGVDVVRFQADLKSGKFKQAIAKDIADGDKVDISGTPTLFINGKRYNGAMELTALKPILDAELKSK